MSEAPVTLVNGRVVLADGVVDGHAVTIRRGRIESVHSDHRSLRAAGVLDLEGGILIPGLIDIHVHGANGRTFNETTPEAWTTTVRDHVTKGTTTLLATVATAPFDELTEALEVGRQLCAKGVPGLAGIHLEGPYLHPEQRGAHGAPWLREPADGSWRELEPYFSGLRLVTLAPELAGALDLIRILKAAGIVTAAGHSTATPEIVEAATAAGLGHFTHLWSGQTSLTRQGPWRQIGLLETALSSDRMTAELIADGAHAPAELTRIAYRCFGADRLCLISDASSGTGLPIGSSFRMGSAEGVVHHGVALTRDGAFFCGSTSFLSDILRFSVRGAGLPLAECVRMAATTPARVLGLGDCAGRIAPGLAADLVVLSDDLEVRSVMKTGAWLEVGIESHA